MCSLRVTSSTVPDGPLDDAPDKELEEVLYLRNRVTGGLNQAPVGRFQQAHSFEDLVAKI